MNPLEADWLSQAQECKPDLLAARATVESLIEKYQGNKIAPHLKEWRKLRFEGSPYSFDIQVNWIEYLNFAAYQDVEDLVAALSQYQRHRAAMENCLLALRGLPRAVSEELRQGLEADLPT